MWSPHFTGERPNMNDPLSEVIALLQPRALFSRRIGGADHQQPRLLEDIVAIGDALPITSRFA